MRVLCRSLLGCILTLSFLAVVAGCGGDGDGDGGTEVRPVAQIDSDAPPLHSFDVYGLASDSGSELRADVYGITLSPLRAYRLTAIERVSWLSAGQDTVVVAAGDEQIDKLGLIAGDGAIAPIPGLGRPAAYSPEIQADGTIRYEDSGPGEAIISRYMSYDPTTRKSRVLYSTKNGDLNIVAAAPDRGFLAVVQADEIDDQVLLMQTDGTRKAFTIAPRISSPASGKSLISVGVYGSPDIDAPVTDTALLNPQTGKVRVIEGWAPLSWTPDGTKLLVVRAADSRLPDAELAVLDPTDPQNPQILGTIAGLTFFQADWVARD